MRKLQLVFLLVGLGALAWMVYRLGPEILLDGILAIGFGFIFTCSAHLGALLLDSVTLRACAGRDDAPPYLHFARASIAGHGINESTPFGKLGEITKYTLLREKLPAERAAGALWVRRSPSSGSTPAGPSPPCSGWRAACSWWPARWGSSS